MVSGHLDLSAKLLTAVPDVKLERPTPSLEQALVSRELPTVNTRVVGTVQTLHWEIPEEREKACQQLQLHAADSPDGPATPLVIKNAVSDWPALTRWTLDHFQEQYGEHRVHVRCAPSMRFFYVEPRLLPMWRRWRRLLGREALPPSELREMRMAELIQRLQVACPLKPLVYPQEEFYYMQTSLTNGMLRDIKLYSPPLSCLGMPGATGPPGQPPAFMPTGLEIAQAPRIFVSPAGAISPLHYDTASSFLTQIRGRKRLLFYQPADLARLYPHGKLHILRRRARVDPAAPDFHRFPKFRGVEAVEAVLEPGDLLWFPGYWSHYTESLEFSMSMTYRFWTEELQKRVKGGICGMLRN